VDIEKIVTELKRERDRLSRAIASLGTDSPKAARRNRTPHRHGNSEYKRRALSPEGRKRILEAMKRRWAEHRKKASR
jgi:hypothetical protein